MKAKTFGFHSPRVGRSRDLNAFTQVAFYYRSHRKEGKEFKTKIIRTKKINATQKRGSPSPSEPPLGSFSIFSPISHLPTPQIPSREGKRGENKENKGSGNRKRGEKSSGKQRPRGGSSAPQRPAAPRPPAPPFGRGAPPPFCRPHSEPRRRRPSPPPARPGPNPAQPGCC